jgi:hypothetical protein
MPTPSYDTFINRVFSKIERCRIKIRESKCLINFHKDCLANHNNQYPPDVDYHDKRIATCEKALETELNKMKTLLHLTPDESGNGNQIAHAYIESLPTNETCINLSLSIQRIAENYSVTKVPDLSRMIALTELRICGHNKLTTGLECIPKTVTHLFLNTTGFANVSELGKMLNLREIYLSQCANIRELPDISKLTELKYLGLSQTNLQRIPKLPPNLSQIKIPIVKNFFTPQEIALYINQNNQANRCVWLDLNKFIGTPIHEFIWRSEWIHNFYQIREELLEQAAKISMHPNRIARLLESEEMEFEKIEERDNLFNYQKL